VSITGTSGKVLIDKSRDWNYRIYAGESGDEVWTIINGVKYRLPSRTTLHQEILGDIIHLMGNFSKRTKAGKVILSPFDVILDERNVVQPDIFYVNQGNAGIIREPGCFGSPDLCVEIVESWSVAMDTLIKKDLYERFGVKEYWIVFPAERAIEIFALEDGRYVLASHCDGEGSVASRLLPGFTVAVADLWNQEA
jgi:Uma2 family endonuclease